MIVSKFPQLLYRTKRFICLFHRCCCFCRGRCFFCRSLSVKFSVVGWLFLEEFLFCSNWENTFPGETFSYFYFILFFYNKKEAAKTFSGEALFFSRICLLNNKKQTTGATCFQERLLFSFYTRYRSIYLYLVYIFTENIQQTSGAQIDSGSRPV